MRRLELFRGLFAGLESAYGTRDLDTGRVRQVKAPMTDEVLADHLSGRRHIGVYLLVRDHTRALAVDFDTQDLWPVREFMALARHYGLPAYVERSKSKGHHVWAFFSAAGVSAAKARCVVLHMLEEIGCRDTEVFPKQDRLDHHTAYGNFIFAPLFGRLVPHGRTVFMLPTDLTQPVPDQWGFLRSVKRIDEAELDAFIEINELAPSTEPPRPVAGATRQLAVTRGLPPCGRRMLIKGVTRNQRVSCFRLAVQLKGTSLPFEYALAVLYEWARRIRPANGNRIITPGEILSQTRRAYDRPYRSYGCDDPAIQVFCVPGCPVRNAASCSTAYESRPICATERRPAMSGTTSNRPVKELRVRNLSLAIWENEGTSRDGRSVTRHSITLNKRYQDQQSGEWRDSSSFFPDDLPRLRLLLDKAYEHLLLSDGDSPGPANGSAG